MQREAVINMVITPSPQKYITDDNSMSYLSLEEIANEKAIST
jgi:hypothetical protein